MTVVDLVPETCIAAVRTASSYLLSVGRLSGDPRRHGGVDRGPPDAQRVDSVAGVMSPKPVEPGAAAEMLRSRRRRLRGRVHVLSGDTAQVPRPQDWNRAACHTSVGAGDRHEGRVHRCRGRETGVHADIEPLWVRLWDAATTLAV